QFAIMGSIYYTAMTGKATPTVGIVSNGEEDGKGNELVREAGDLLKASALNFIGNIEPSDFFEARSDVAVADGFVGNILLKTAEATAKYLVGRIRTEIGSSVLSTIGGSLARPALRRVADNLNPNKVGGVPLLGVNGIVIIGHGSSTSEGVKNAIGQARKGVEFGIVDAIRTGIERGGR
ncbi:MAG: phosphate--acyl-ACP acyltransferase, partial [Chloroflexota bacterium]